MLTGGPDPLFTAEYVNGARSSVFQTEINTAIQAPPAFDEGGNFIRPTYGPLSLYNDTTANDGDPGDLFGDYHILGGSPAVDKLGGVDLTPTYPALLFDFDAEPRPSGAGVDIGADEVQQAAAAPVARAPQPEESTTEPPADKPAPKRGAQIQSKD